MLDRTQGGVAAEAAGSPGAEVLLAPVGRYPRGLYRGLTHARLGIVLVLGALLPGQRSLHGELVWLIAALWLGIAVWAVVAELRKELFDFFSRRPTMVSVEALLAVVLFVAGGAWHNLFYLYAWIPIGLASVFQSKRMTLITAAGLAAGEILAYVAWALFGGDVTARSDATAVAWGQNLFGFVVAGAAFWYVRSLTDGIDMATRLHLAATEEALQRDAALVAQARREQLADHLHRHLRQLFPAMTLRLRSAMNEASADELPALKRAEQLVAAADDDTRALVRRLADAGGAQR